MAQADASSEAVASVQAFLQWEVHMLTEADCPWPAGYSCLLSILGHDACNAPEG